MFKNSLKIILLGAVLAASILPIELYSAMSYRAGVETGKMQSTVLCKSYVSLKRFCHLFTDRPTFFVRKHPIISIGVTSLVTFGVVGYYSGLFSWMCAQRKQVTPKQLINFTPEQEEQLKKNFKKIEKNDVTEEKQKAINIASAGTNLVNNNNPTEEITLSTDCVECLLKSEQNRSHEDVGTLSHFKLGDKEAVIMAVFDGNGNKKNPEIPRLLANNLQEKIAHELLQLTDLEVRDQKLVSEKLTTLFKDFDKTLSCKKGGSTACIGVFLPQHNVFVVANTGDSQLGLIQEVEGKSGLFITACHNPEEEGTRIPKEAITLDLECKGWGRLDDLLLSRCFGYVTNTDGAKSYSYLIVDPEITIFDLNKTKIQGVVIGSDGLWDPFEQTMGMYVQSIITTINQPSTTLADSVNEAIKKSSNVEFTVSSCVKNQKPKKFKNTDDITIGLMRFK